MSEQMIPVGLEAALAAAPATVFEDRHGDDVALVAPDELVAFACSVVRCSKPASLPTVPSMPSVIPAEKCIASSTLPLPI